MNLGVKKLAGKYPRPPRDPNNSDDERKKKQDEAKPIVDFIKDIVDNPDAFDDLLDAADMVYENEAGGYGKFVSACNKAGIHKNDAIKYLWNLLSMRSVATAKSWLDAPFCWG